MTGKHSGHEYIRGNYELGQHDDALWENGTWDTLRNRPYPGHQRIAENAHDSVFASFTIRETPPGRGISFAGKCPLAQ